MIRKKNPTDIKVGDRVRFTYGLADATGVVIEYRGPLGIGGEHIYRIRFSTDPEWTAETEMPACKFEVVRDEAKGN